MQLDLFGEQAAREAWRARFERADWVAPWDTASGMRKGDRRPGGWVCPNCREVEPNQYWLSASHGWDPDRPGRLPFGHGRECVAQHLRRCHREYDERMRAARARPGPGTPPLTSSAPACRRAAAD